MPKDRLLSINTEPLKLVDASVRDVWTRSTYRPRCHHEDGRGQCTSRETKAYRVEPGRGGIWRLCDRHKRGTLLR